MTDLNDRELQEYLDEFEDVTRFDAEICPKCGLDFTKDQISVASWIIVSDDLQFDQLKNIGDLLEENGIHYFFSESEKTSHGNKLYALKVLNETLESTKELLNN